MKITLFLNNQYIKYNSLSNNKLINLDINLIKKNYNTEDLYILRGEPTLRLDLHQVLDIFKDKNYILTTDCSNLKILTQYKKIIPYISFYWDGIMNDKIRNKNLNLNLLRALNYFSGKKTKTRLTYIISNYNYDWINVDILALKNFITFYPKMKRPYIVLFQQSEIFDYNNFYWPALSKQVILEMNNNSILTEKTLKSLIAWSNRESYQCVSPQEEVIINYDGTVRMCMSHRFSEILGNLNEKPLKEILNDSKEEREKSKHCPFREKCWITFHHKGNFLHI